MRSSDFQVKFRSLEIIFNFQRRDQEHQWHCDAAMKSIKGVKGSTYAMDLISNGNVTWSVYNLNWKRKNDKAQLSNHYSNGEEENLKMQLRMNEAPSNTATQTTKVI